MSETNLAEIFPEDQDEGPADKDGHDNEPPNLQRVEIDVAVNGYSVCFMYDDGSEERYVQEDFDDVLKLIRSKH